MLNKLNIKIKLILIFASIGLLIPLFGIINLTRSIQQFNDDMKYQEGILKEALIQRGTLITQNFASSSQSALLENNFFFLFSAIQTLMEDHSEIIWAMIINKEGKILIHSDPSVKLQKQLEDVYSQKAIKNETILIQEHKFNDEDIIDIAVPIMIEDNKWGTIRCAFTLKQLQKEIILAKRKNQRRIRESIIYTISVTFIFIIFSIILATLFGNTITNPIIHLVEGVKLVSEGQWQQQVPVESEDEIGQLANAFNEMSQSISTFDNITRTASSTLDLDIILNAVLDLIKNIIDYKISAILLLDERNEKNKWLIKASRGLTKQTEISFFEDKWVIFDKAEKQKEPIVLNDIETKTESIIDIKSSVVVSLRSEEKVIGILYLGSDKKSNFPNQRVKLLFTLSEIIAMAIDNARLYAELGEKERLKTEMALARKIQTQLLPKTPEIDKLDIAAKMQTADQVGGDYYDFILRESNNNYWIGIGDVTGHGVTSGLVMMMAQSVFTALIHHTSLNVKEVYTALNKTLSFLLKRMGTSHLMTLMPLIYHGDYKFSFVNAHVDVLIYRDKTQEVEIIAPDSLWLNLEEELVSDVIEKIFLLEKKDILILYTDGITEAINEDGIIWNVGRLSDAVKSYNLFPAKEMIKHIYNEVYTWMGKHPQLDDMTMLVIKAK